MAYIGAMSFHILYEACPWHRRAALFDEQGRLLTLRLDDDLEDCQEGCVILGRVRKVEPSLGGAFVDIGDQNDGFLAFNTLMPEMRKAGLTEGQALLVRVARAGFHEKGAKLDGRVSVKCPDNPGKIPCVVQKPPGVLTRALHDSGATPVQGWIADARLRDVMARHLPEHAIHQVDESDDTQWYERLDTELDVMLARKPTFNFPGGNLIVEMTSAVATIDVNLTPTQGNKRDAQLAGNLLAASHIARLCRLLDLGGSVIVDFVTPSVPSHRDVITDHLIASFQTSDDRFVSARRMSRHGLVEITRERIGASLTLLLEQPHAVAGRILLDLWRTPAGRNSRVHMREVRCHPDVAHILGQRLTTEICLSHLGLPVVVKPDSALAPAAYQLLG